MAAVEFALVAPIFLAMLFGIIAFGTYLSVMNAVEQLAAEAARSSMPGLSDTERTSLAQQNIAAHVAAYPFVDPTRLTVVSSATDPTTKAFSIVLRYDASNLAVFRVPLVPLPSLTIQRSASIQRGGL